jgi:hypothetical protein
MPELREVSYSREATIAAFRDYYQFLTKMYLPESMVEEPPAGGWPSITNENVHLLGKDNEVAELMRHLPYISDESLLAPHAQVAHWPTLLAQHPHDQQASFDGSDVDDLRLLSEDLEWENVPSSAFGISVGHMTFILDTQFGVVHWLDAPDEARYSPAREGIVDDFWDCTPENEHEWRCGPAWAIVDFFEVLKKQYRDLQYLPVHKRRLETWYENSERRPVLGCIRQIYQEHGWPDLSLYKKAECLRSVAKSIEERFPDEEF